MADWSQAGANPARTSFQPAESLGTAWSVAWEFHHHLDLLPRERIWPGLEPVISAGHVLVGTLMGKLRSFATGLVGPTIQWSADVGAPIVATPAADGTNAYVADAYGRLSAWRLTDGVNVWGPLQITPGQPFRGAVLLADGKLLVGAANGVFYAVQPSNGSLAWAPYDLGPLTPILGGAAWSNNGGVNRVVFGAEDMKVRALDSGTGALLWTSPRLPGASFQLYWPVLTGSTVVIRAQPQYPPYNPDGATPTYRGLEADVDAAGAQDTVLAAYDVNPSNYSTNLHLLNLATGALLPSPIHWHYAWGHGSLPAPCLDRDGRVVIPIILPSSRSSFGTQWGRLDLGTRKITDYFWDSATNSDGNNPDEHLFATACANGVVGMHCQEANAAKSGFWSQPANVWTIVRNDAANTTGFELFYNHQGPCPGPAAISGGLVYHLAQYHRLVAWRTT